MQNKRKHGLTVAERIERYRVVVGECWEINLDLKRRYPMMNIEGRKVFVHRASWEAYESPIPDGLFVLHKCDNPRCHRPAHLFLGTYLDNMQDMVAKGRHRSAPPRVDPTFALVLSKVLSQQEIAEIIGCSQPAVSSALRRAGISRGRSTSFGKGHGKGGWPKGRKKS